MKICIISPVKTYPPTGDSERVVNIAKGLARIGYNVHLFIYNHHGMEIAPKNLKVTTLPYMKLSRNRLFRLLCKSIGLSAAELTELGISAFLPSFFIRAAIGSKGSDIVLIEGGLPNPFLALLIKGFYKKKLVYCSHGSVELVGKSVEEYSLLTWLIDKIKKNTFTLFENLIVRIADRIIVVSSKEKQWYKMRYHLKDQKITLIPNFIDLNHVKEPNYEILDTIREKYKISVNDYVIAFVGNLASSHNIKAVDYIVNKIVPTIKALSRKQLKFLIIGPGHSGLPYKSNEDIVFTGYVDDIVSVLHLAHICIAPILGSAGIKTKLLLYMACKKPIIATEKAVEGIEFKDSRTIAIAKNINEFPKLILDVINDSERAHVMANEAHRLVEENYSLQTALKRIEVIIKQLINYSK